LRLPVHRGALGRSDALLLYLAKCTMREIKTITYKKRVQSNTKRVARMTG